jgi:hypothetical protein
VDSDDPAGREAKQRDQIQEQCSPLSAFPDSLAVTATPNRDTAASGFANFKATPSSALQPAQR